MKIGVISDTHLKGCDKRLQRVLDHHFGGVELVLHAGDLVDLSVLEMFGDKEVRAVYGNTDQPRVRRTLADKLVFDVNGFRLVLIHDSGISSPSVEKVAKEFGRVDCLIFGHTHRPVNRVKEGVLYFNPGSATCNRFAPFNSIGILDIEKTVRGEIIELRGY